MFSGSQDEDPPAAHNEVQSTASLGDLEADQRDMDANEDNGDAVVSDAQIDEDASNEQAATGAHEEARVLGPTLNDDEIKERGLFKNTKAESVTLGSAKDTIHGTFQRVEEAIDKVNGATDQYHSSINRLTNTFGRLHVQAADVHSDLLNEFKEREKKRMCAFANAERLLRGEKYQPCDVDSAASGESTGDGITSHFAEHSDAHDDAPGTLGAGEAIPQGQGELGSTEEMPDPQGELGSSGSMHEDAASHEMHGQDLGSSGSMHEDAASHEMHGQEHMPEAMPDHGMEEPGNSLDD